LRLAVSILIVVDEDWITSRRYLTMDEELSCADMGPIDFTEKWVRYLIFNFRSHLYKANKNNT